MTHHPEDTTVAHVMETLIENGLEGRTDALTVLMNEAMKLERSKFLQATPFERTEGRREVVGFSANQDDAVPIVNMSTGSRETTDTQVRGPGTVMPAETRKAVPADRPQASSYEADYRYSPLTSLHLSLASGVTPVALRHPLRP